MKLPKPQRTVIRVMAEHNCSASTFQKGGTAFAFLRQMRKKLFAGTLLALERKGLLKVVREYDWHERRFILTPRGHEIAEGL